MKWKIEGLQLAVDEPKPIEKMKIGEAIITKMNRVKKYQLVRVMI